MNWRNIGKTVIVMGAMVTLISLVAPHNDVSEKEIGSEAGSRTIQIAGQDIRATVVSTPDARAKGLGGRGELAPDEGMLFVFDSDAKYRFWMKDMNFPIDILWLSSTGEVLDIRESVSPLTYPAIFEPREPARYVLELSAGFSEEYKVKVGDIAEL